MNPLHILAARPDMAATAMEIMAACGISHEQAYTELVALESSGAVRVVVDHTDRRTCSGIARWELMPAGVRRIFR